MLRRFKELAVTDWQRCSAACLRTHVQDAGFDPTCPSDARLNTSKHHFAARDVVGTLKAMDGVLLI